MSQANGGYKNHKFCFCALEYIWTTHGMVIDNITFDKEPWESMKTNFKMFNKDFI